MYLSTLWLPQQLSQSQSASCHCSGRLTMVVAVAAVAAVALGAVAGVLLSVL
jgi:hypothetical protein